MSQLLWIIQIYCSMLTISLVVSSSNENGRCRLCTVILYTCSHLGSCHAQCLWHPMPMCEPTCVCSHTVQYSTCLKGLLTDEVNRYEKSWLPSRYTCLVALWVKKKQGCSLDCKAWIPLSFFMILSWFLSSKMSHFPKVYESIRNQWWLHWETV